MILSIIAAIIVDCNFTVWVVAIVAHVGAIIGMLRAIDSFIITSITAVVMAARIIINLLRIHRRNLGLLQLP